MLIRAEREPSDLALQVRNPRSRKKQHPVQDCTARHSKAKCLFSALKHSWDFFFFLLLICGQEKYERNV